jgi:hypothetical protein
MRSCEEVLLEFTDGDGVEGHVPFLNVERMADRIRSLEATPARDAEVVRRAHENGNVIVEVATELLDADVWTDKPLYVLLTKNTDGTHLLTFRGMEATTERVTEACLTALRGYEQADHNGVMVLVSREALDEAIAALTGGTPDAA